MNSQDFQDKLDAIVTDLQTKGKGKTVNIMFRNPNNTPNVLPLSSDASGVVNSSQLSAIQSFVTNQGAIAENYETAYAPVKSALEAFKTAQTPHEGLMTAAATARKNLQDALDADQTYQSAKTALDTARNDQTYIDSLSDYKNNNVSENFSELQAAKGNYVW